MLGKRLPNDTLPRQPGEYALFLNQPRPGTRTGIKDELFVVDPLGNLFALIPEIHRWEFDQNGLASVSPSIVSPNHTFHGYLTAGVWS